MFGHTPHYLNAFPALLRGAGIATRSAPAAVSGRPPRAPPSLRAAQDVPEGEGGGHAAGRGGCEKLMMMSEHVVSLD